jgi:hypothetical protein
MEKLVWMPKLTGTHDFTVDVDRDFAKGMIDAKIAQEGQRNMNRVANQIMEVMGLKWLDPYHFHGESALVDQFYLGQNGVWLATERYQIDSLLNGEKADQPIHYSSHNVDSPSQAYHLMRLVSLWVEYAEMLREFRPTEKGSKRGKR